MSSQRRKTHFAEGGRVEKAIRKNLRGSLGMRGEAHGWHEARLGDVIELKRGYDLPQQQRRPGRVAVVSSSGPSGFHSEAKVKAPGVVTGRYGTIGQVFYVAEDFWPLNTTLYVRDFKGNDPKFISYLLRTIDFLSCSDKAAVPGVNRNQLHELNVVLPPLSDQRAIANILGTLDDKIELNRQTNETLEAMARSLFKSWFVDFDPVRAKAADRHPSGMDAETAKLFPRELVESELGEIPKGWTCSPLEHWASALSGGTPSKSNPSLWNGDLPWISPKVMTSIHADEADAFVTRQAVGNGTRIAPAGSTLIMVRGMGLHQEVRVSQVRREVTFNQDVKALVPRQIEASLLLFAMLDAQEVLLGRVESSGHGTGKLPSEILPSHPIVMPDAKAQRKLAGVFTSINDRIASARAENRHLAALRDTLLPALLSGEVSVGGAERVLEAQA
jgi:type I restriction enzyme S subunit